MGKYAIILLFFSVNSFAGINCELDTNSHVTFGYTIQLKGCTEDIYFISPSGHIESPIFKINSFKIPYKEDKTKFADLTSIMEKVSLDSEAMNCKSAECILNFDLSKGLLASETYQNKLKEQGISDKLDFENAELESSLIGATLPDNTPLFSMPSSTKYIDLDHLYNDQTVKAFTGGNDPEKLKESDLPFSFTGDPLAAEVEEHPIPEGTGFTDEEIAQENFKHNNADVESEVELVADLETGPVSNTPSNEREQSTYPINIPFQDGDKKYEFEIKRKEGDNYLFTLSDGENIQAFSSPDIMVELSEKDNITDLVWDESGKIEYKFFGLDTHLNASVLSDKVKISEIDDPETKPEAKEKAEVVATKEQKPKNNSTCLSMINDFLNDKDFSEESVRNFLKVQGSLTLHKLALTNLNSTVEKENLENQILRLIKEKYKGENGKIAREFDQLNPNSRNFLAKALPLLQDILNNQLGNDQLQQAFGLKVSDLKMVELMAKYEEINEKTGQFDHRQFISHKVKNNMANLTTLINSAYKHSVYKINDQKDKERNIALLQSLIPQYEKELQLEIKSIIFKSCVESKGLSCEQAQAEVNNIFTSDLDTIMNSILINLFNQTDEDILDPVKYGKLWLRVSK